MLSLTYVSRAQHAPLQRPEAVAAEICRASASSNQHLEITGALIATTDHFAQVLEGPAPSIALLMQKIHSDTRHCEIRVLQTCSINARTFPNWSMAYAGAPVSTDQFIARALMGGSDVDVNAELLARLITQFARSRQLQGKLRGIANVQPPQLRTKEVSTRR